MQQALEACSDIRQSASIRRKANTPAGSTQFHGQIGIFADFDVPAPDVLKRSAPKSTKGARNDRKNAQGI